MPKFAKGHQVHIDTDVSYALRDRFKAACKAKGVSMGEAVRIIIEAWTETVEAEQRESAPVN